jgi:signal transduction histidine kinase
MHELVHHSHADGRHYAETDCPIFRAFRKGEPCRVDSEVFWRADGRAIEVEYSSHPIVDAAQVRGAVITFLDITERRRAEELLRSARDELESRVDERTAALSAALKRLRELTAHADSVREEERKRIAREVHDELGSLFIALKLDVNWLQRRLGDREELQSKCRAMARAIEGAVDNVGRIITDLRPSILDHQGLLAALEWQIAEFRESAEIECASRIHVAAGVPAPDGAAATAVFRIFQELLSNIGRHASASRVDIVVALEDGSLTVEVRDNGRGAPAAAFDSPHSYGILGMRERARHLGGDLRIVSQPGAGTRVRLTVPLAAAPAQAPAETSRDDSPAAV